MGRREEEAVKKKANKFGNGGTFGLSLSLSLSVCVSLARRAKLGRGCFTSELLRPFFVLVRTRSLVFFWRERGVLAKKNVRLLVSHR